jgi:mannosyltransferase OCH1-like enzyme
MNFEEAMLKCNTGMEPSDKWKAVEDAYNETTRYLHVPSDSQQVDRIPKILHQFWHGGPMPEKYQQLTELWRKMHPDWSYILWDEQRVAEFELVNKWMYDNMKNPSAKSDVVRYEVAYSYGGVYMDTDFYCCQNFDKLLYLDFFAGMVGSYDGRLVSLETSVAPSIFGCSQGNKLIGQIIQKIGRVTTIPRSIPEIMTLTGPEMFSKEVVNELSKHPMSVVFPPTYFYSFPGQHRTTIRHLSLKDTEKALSRYIYPETYAIHLCYCSWQRTNLL